MLAYSLITKVLISDASGSIPAFRQLKHLQNARRSCVTTDLRVMRGGGEIFGIGERL